MGEGEGIATIHVRPEITKTKKGRITFASPQAVQHLFPILRALKPQGRVFSFSTKGG